MQLMFYLPGVNTNSCDTQIIQNKQLKMFQGQKHVLSPLGGTLIYGVTWSEAPNHFFKMFFIWNNWIIMTL